MADTEPFDLAEEVRKAAKAEGGTVRNSVMVFDAAPDPNAVPLESWIAVGRQCIDIAFPTYIAAKLFLKRAAVALERLLDKSSIRINLEIGGERPARFSLRADYKGAKAAIEQKADEEE